jgi:transposase InsO family protein
MAGHRGRKRHALVAPAAQSGARHDIKPEQRLLLLDTWRRSGLPAGDFASLVGISKHTLYGWRKRFEQHGPAGLVDQPRGGKPGSRLPELTRRTILMLKESHPEWGCERISDMLARGPALPASASAVARVLHAAGYESVDQPTRPHPEPQHRFERARPNQLWPTDLFTFVLKRQNRRVYLVAFLDDHSRFIVSYGLHASQSTALVLEVLEAAIAARDEAGPLSTSSESPSEEVVSLRDKSLRDQSASASAAASLQPLWHIGASSDDPRTRRRARKQQPRRAAEDAARQVATCAALSTRCRGSQRQLATAVGVSLRTLRCWKAQQRAGTLQPHLRGRPPQTCDVATRNDVIHFLHQVSGPSVALAALRALFPQVSPAILAELLRRYRRLWRRRYRHSGFQLTWHRAGAVWAMDFSQTPQVVDAVKNYAFAVRDLASRQQLAWEPVSSEKAEVVLSILVQLFAQYGPPLVLKRDNGSGFIAELTQSTLEAETVAALFSPARHPQYNGGLERSNSTLKTYTHQHARSQGHPLRWTSDDLHHARQLANTISRPWGHRGPTPDDAWQSRTPLTLEERAQFQQALAQQRQVAAVDLGLDLSTDLAHADRSRLDRLAISRTLAQLGYLTMRRVTCAPRKPKRPQRETLARKLSKHQEESPPCIASESAPVECSSPKSAAMLQDPIPPMPVGMKQSKVPKPARTLPSQEKSSRALAPPRAGATMQASTAQREALPIGNLTPPLAPACGERAASSWWRRPFTLLQSVLKAAKIKR